MSQPENTKKSRKEMKADKKRLKDEKRLAKARIRSERAAMAKAKREPGRIPIEHLAATHRHVRQVRPFEEGP